MFKTLMQLPLFHGISYTRLQEIVGKYPFHFHKYSDGEIIIGEGSEMRSIVCLVNGRVELTHADTVGYGNDVDGQMSLARGIGLRQYVAAPDVFGVVNVFGKHQISPYSVRAVGNVSVLLLDKRDYNEMMRADQAIMFNILNMVSVEAQLLNLGRDAIWQNDLAKRIVFQIICLTHRNSVDIEIKLEDNHWGRCFGADDTRMAISELQQKGLVELSGNNLYVPQRRSLIRYLESGVG